MECGIYGKRRPESTGYFKKNGMEYNDISEEDREKFVEVSKSCYDKFKELIKDDELFDATAEFCGKAE